MYVLGGRPLIGWVRAVIAVMAETYYEKMMTIRFNFNGLNLINNNYYLFSKSTCCREYEGMS
jgi:hypothetical protein